MSSSGGDRQLEILKQFLVDLDECYGDDALIVQEVKSSVCSLMDCVSRRRIENVAELARQGKSLKAHQLMRHYFPIVALDSVHEVLQLIYLDAENLQSAIEFAKLCEPQELLVGAFNALVEAVLFRKLHTNKIEILFLKKSINDLKVPELDGGKDLNLNHVLIIRRIVTELKNNDLSTVNQISARFGNQLLDMTLSDVMSEFCNFSPENVLQLIRVSQKLPHTSNRCSLLVATWKKLPGPIGCYQNYHDLPNAMVLMHLWAHARAVHEEKHYTEVDLIVRIHFEAAVLAFLKGFMLNTHYNIQHFGGHQPNLKENRDMVWLLAKVAFERLKGNVHLLKMSEQECQVDNEEVLACILCLMLRDKVQKHSFEEFCVLAKAQQLTEASERPIRSLCRLMDEVPTCLHRLLGLGAKYQLINKFFQQPLCVLNSKVFVGEPADEQLMWAITLQPVTMLATFLMENYSDGRLSAQTREVAYSDSQKAGLWKIKAVDDQHVKIFSEKGKNKLKKILKNCFYTY